MNFPKKAMTITQLNKMGLPKDWLRELSRTQKFCFRAGTAINSPILFDTDELSKYIATLERIKANEVCR